MNQFTQEQIDKMMLTQKGKYSLIENKVNLDVLIKDEDFYVRLAVAKQGYGLDVLINDEDFRVRLAVAKQGYGLDVLLYDENSTIRTQVARQGYGLDTLINDKRWLVRLEVAEHGFGIEQLINDRVSDIVEICNELKGVIQTIVIDKFFGTYEGNLFLYIFEDKYMIRSGCYVSENLEEWKNKCKKRIGEETAEIYYKKIKAILESSNFELLDALEKETSNAR